MEAFQSEVEAECARLEETVRTNSTVYYCSLRQAIMQHSTIQCSTAQYSAVQ